MSVEVREVLIRTEINGKPANGGELTAEQLKQLKKDLLEQTMRNINKNSRQGYNR